MMFTLRKRRLKKVRFKGEESSSRARRRRRREERQGRGKRRGRGRAMSEVGFLPSEVMELIFDRLPTFSLLRFTAVCKRWRDLIVARMAASGVPMVTEDWMVMITDGLHLGKLSAYNVGRERWYSVRLPVDSNNRFPFAVAADGNLVCMSDRCYRKFGTYGRVVVCDPVRKQWHELPPLRSWGVIQGMAVDPATRAVKILATNFLLDGDDCAYKLTCAELYDSSAPMMQAHHPSPPARSWKMVLPPTPLLAADCCSVFCGTRFLFLSPDDSLFAFDLRDETWTRMPTSPLPAPRRSLQAHKKLVACDDSILLLTIEVNKQDPASFHNLVVWRLTPAMEWVEAAKAPPSVTSRFFNADAIEEDPEQDAKSVPQLMNGYSSLHHWTASGEAHNDVFRVWAVTVGRSAVFLKNTLLPQLLQVDLSKAGDTRWRWVLCPHHVPLSARPFRFAL